MKFRIADGSKFSLEEAKAIIDYVSPGFEVPDDKPMPGLLASILIPVDKQPAEPPACPHRHVDYRMREDKHWCADCKTYVSDWVRRMGRGL
jgi:hypothetical protein